MGGNNSDTPRRLPATTFCSISIPLTYCLPKPLLARTLPVHLTETPHLLFANTGVGWSCCLQRLHDKVTNSSHLRCSVHGSQWDGKSLNPVPQPLNLLFGKEGCKTPQPASTWKVLPRKATLKWEQNTFWELLTIRHLCTGMASVHRPGSQRAPVSKEVCPLS